eukprot:CAMPEP_0178751290 /NCGR_PEP_ID=MMETSP0744-20121128/10451_1 /TAXON_ID=913974 /ORGANISM="Nitzschia punctata, Strain CCMP561" /LENGTH=422 /DNA_ID=CAMNT_0020404933 /DNA_START=152 /DNA_END=1420 /DNA_ORIENTATION=-
MAGHDIGEEMLGWKPSFLKGSRQAREVKESSFRVFPRTLSWNYILWEPANPPLSVDSPPQSKHFLDTYESHDEEDDLEEMQKYLVLQFTDDYQDHCVYMKDWQSMSYPTCNLFHEIGMDPNDLVAFNEGGWRQTFFHRQIPESVLKLFHLDEDDDYPFDTRTYEIHRVDALISERLTSSPYAIDIFGHCGMSALQEKARDTLQDEAEDDKELDLSAKFRFAYEVARGMADLHGVDYPSGKNATIVHRDLKPSNLLVGMDGHAKISDFNDSILRKWNKTSGEPCAYYNREYPLHWGNGFKPVEHAAKGYPKLDEKIDIFGLGGLLFYVLVGKDPYKEYKDKDAMTAAMKAGKLPRLPKEYNASLTPDLADGVVAIVQAIQSTMALDPKVRPTSKEVFDLLAPVLGKHAAMSEIKTRKNSVIIE